MNEFLATASVADHSTSGGGYWFQYEICHSRQLNVKLHPFIQMLRNIVWMLTRCTNDDSIMLVTCLHVAEVALVQCRSFDSNPASAGKRLASFECCEQSALFWWQENNRFVGVEVWRGEVLLDFEGTGSLDIQLARKPWQCCHLKSLQRHGLEGEYSGTGCARP